MGRISKLQLLWFKPMALNVSRKLIKSHLLEGEMIPGEMIGIRIDQTLTQDATGTLVMLELAAMGLRRARTEVSVQYVDHNLIQADHKNGRPSARAPERFSSVKPPKNGVVIPSTCNILANLLNPVWLR
jgi:homoaconitase/3-isopropylmalate dehydratase large subunit